jgi:phage FluMu protein Com
MAPKHHPTPLSGDRKALGKELVKARAMTGILAERASEKRAAGEALIREADSLSCQSWNERMWADGGPIDPSPTIDQAINGGYAWLEIKCSRCKTPRSVDLAALPHVATTAIHDLAGRLRCQKCAKAGKRPPTELHQLAPRRRHFPGEET